jgi:hypothetical protein
MGRVYGEQVEVSLRGAKPARFVWRDQLYTVLGVRDRWVTTPGGLPAPGGAPTAPVASPPPVAREFWLVEALAGRGDPARSYELRREAATGKWLLSRAWD